jgi:hypothetical protein
VLVTWNSDNLLPLVFADGGLAGAFGVVAGKLGCGDSVMEGKE